MVKKIIGPLMYEPVEVSRPSENVLVKFSLGSIPQQWECELTHYIRLLGLGVLIG